MRVKWATLVTGATLLLGASSASAQSPVTLSGSQLDGIIPTFQLDATQYQLRVAVDTVTMTDPDRVRDALLMGDPEENIAAQQVPDEEPQVRCTPARRALLASAARSEESAWHAAPQQELARTSAAPIRQSAGTASRLSAASPETAIIAASSPERSASGDAGSNRPTAIRNAGSSARPAVANSRRAAPTRSAAVASHAPKVEVPARTVRADRSSRPSGGGTVRAASGANAADIVARVRSQVNRTLAAAQGGGFRLR
jgi:hypothetical protein